MTFLSPLIPLIPADVPQYHFLNIQVWVASRAILVGIGVQPRKPPFLPWGGLSSQEVLRLPAPEASPARGVQAGPARGCKRNHIKP